MLGDEDAKDKHNTRMLLIGLVIMVAVLVVAAMLVMPIASDIISTSLSPGLNLKDAAALSFLITVVVMIVFAVAAGDGLLGELQFMLIGFFFFFAIVWLLLAWIF